MTILKNEAKNPVFVSLVPWTEFKLSPWRPDYGEHRTMEDRGRCEGDLADRRPNMQGFLTDEKLTFAK